MQAYVCLCLIHSTDPWGRISLAGLLRLQPIDGYILEEHSSILLNQRRHSAGKRVSDSKSLMLLLWFPLQGAYPPIWRSRRPHPGMLGGLHEHGASAVSSRPATSGGMALTLGSSGRGQRPATSSANQRGQTPGRPAAFLCFARAFGTRLAHELVRLGARSVPRAPLPAVRAHDRGFPRVCPQVGLQLVTASSRRSRTSHPTRADRGFPSRSAWIRPHKGKRRSTGRRAAVEDEHRRPTEPPRAATTSCRTFICSGRRREPARRRAEGRGGGAVLQRRPP